MGTQRLRALAAVGASASVLVVPSFAAALFASRPKLMCHLGWKAGMHRDPLTVGLPFDDVEYMPGGQGWWIDAPESRAAVVIAHGLETSDEPRATDVGPRLELAAALVRRRYSVLIINLGYANSQHPYSAGRFEASDIEAAVRWSMTRTPGDVAVVGMSAGGHAAVAASRNEQAVFAVVTDSAFVDGGQIIIDQAARMLRLPTVAFCLTRWFMRRLTGVAPLDISAARTVRPPMLHIHGTSDSAVEADNVERLAACTGGEVWLVSNAEHVKCYANGPDVYLARITEFIDNALEKRRDESDH